MTKVGGGAKRGTGEDESPEMQWGGKKHEGY